MHPHAQTNTSTRIGTSWKGRLGENSYQKHLHPPTNASTKWCDLYLRILNINISTSLTYILHFLMINWMPHSMLLMLGFNWCFSPLWQLTEPIMLLWKNLNSILVQWTWCFYQRRFIISNTASTYDLSWSTMSIHMLQTKSMMVNKQLKLHQAIAINKL